MIVGTAGGHHNLQFSATLLEGDELYGDGPFEVYVYGGYTSAADSSGRISELQTLRNALVDRMGPLPVSGIEYPTTNLLVLNFDEAVNTATVVKTGIGFCNDEDGVAEVSLTSSDALATTGFSKRLSFNLSSATAAALEALSGSVELLLAANTVKDAAANGNTAVTNLDNIPVTLAPVTTITIDGNVSDADWACAEARLNDLWDSAWNGSSPGDTDEILVLFADWDSTYLYLGIRGHVMGNSWLLYLDTDVDGPDGFTDLTAIDAWERGAVFTATGRKVKSVFDGRLAAGGYTLDWDGRTEAGESAPPGIYLVRVAVDGKVIGTAKIARVR